MFERTKHEIQTPYGVVYLTLRNKTRDGDSKVEFITAEGKPLQLPFKQRRLVLSSFVLVRSQLNRPEDTWDTSNARGLVSRLWLYEGEELQVSPAPSAPSVSKLTAYLKGLLPTWLAAHPIEVQEAAVQNAQEDLWEAQEAAALAERELDKLKSTVLAATATLEQAERKLDSYRLLPPITALTRTERP